MTALVVGVGNVLRRDDGFGVAVAERLAAVGVPDGARLVEVGIGGVALVQELLGTAYDALVVIDLVDRGRSPGTVMVLEPEVEDLLALEPVQRLDVLADAHLATPARSLALARALGVLPPRVLLVGCQPLDADGIGRFLSPAVATAVPVAVEEVRRVVAELVDERAVQVQVPGDGWC